MRRSAIAVAALSTLLALLGCGGGGAIAGTDGVGVPPSPREPAVAPAEGVVEVALECDADGAERCDATDDDCDGAIDEGCGLATGELQITATWSDATDVDLIVTDPSGDSLGAGAAEVASGGRLDHAGRGNCAEGDAHARIENAAWRTAPTGAYQIALRRGEGCGTPDDAETIASVTIRARDRVHGAYNVRLTAGATVSVGSVTLR